MWFRSLAVSQMRTETLGLMLVVLAVSCGCSHTKKRENPSEVLTDDRLVVAAQEIKRELILINNLTGKTTVKPSPSNPQLPAEFKRIVSIDYDGDVDHFLSDLRATNLFDVRVVGKRPAQDIALSLHHKNVQLWRVIEDAGIQIGQYGTFSIGREGVVLSYAPIN